MMVRFMRWVGSLVVDHPGLVTALSLVGTLFLYANIHNLRTGTDLTDINLNFGVPAGSNTGDGADDL